MQFAITTIILILTILLNIGIVYAVFTSSVSRRRINQIFGIHIIGIIGWALFILIIIWLPRITGVWDYSAGSLGYNIEKLIFFFATLFVSTNYWFVQYFVHKKFRRTLLNYVVLTFQGFIFLLTLADDRLYTAVSIQPQGYAFLAIEPLNNIFALFLLFHLVVPLGILLKGWLAEKQQQVIGQYRLLFSIYLIFFFASVTLNWILPVYFAIFTFNAFGPTISLILVGGIAYAIIRHQFLDIKVVIQRGVIYTTLFVTIVGFYLIIINVVGLFLQQNTDVAILLAAGITTLIGIFTVPTIDRKLKRVTDHIFFKDRYVYAEALESLSALVNTTIKLRKLLTGVSAELERILRIEQVRFLLEEKDSAIIEKLYPDRVTSKLSDHNAPLLKSYLETVSEATQSLASCMHLQIF